MPGISAASCGPAPRSALEAVITSDPAKVVPQTQNNFSGRRRRPQRHAVPGKTGLDTALKNAFASGVPILGICIGAQIILESSEEGEPEVSRPGAGQDGPLPPGGQAAQDTPHGLERGESCSAASAARRHQGGRRVLFRPLVLPAARRQKRTFTPSPATASNSARRWAAATSSPPSSTPRRAAGWGWSSWRGLPGGEGNKVKTSEDF